MDQKLIVLTSPPASGKTFWISELKKSFLEEEILVISPLRALAEECKEKWENGIKVMTPEEWLGKKTHHRIVILDEFHLFFYWGDTFRPLMWEAFFEIVSWATYTFALTATLSSEMRNEVRSFSCHFDEILWFDHGNQRLKFLPSLYIKAPHKKWLEDFIFLQEKSKFVQLIFCRYREEVFYWERKLNSHGYSVISCVGGEGRQMKEKLQRNPRPDFIVSTTVLSHGVNLPEIRRLYLLYAIKNIDFWVQMVARGGRRGEKFEVYALENPEGIKWNKWTNYLAILWISLKMKLKQNARPEWFLRD